MILQVCVECINDNFSYNYYASFSLEADIRVTCNWSCIISNANMIAIEHVAI